MRGFGGKKTIMKNLTEESDKIIKEMKEAFKRVGVSFSGINKCNKTV